MRDGSLNNIVDERFCWWIIWHKKHKLRVYRNRRQIEGSGDDDEDDYEEDNYDYDDEDEEDIEAEDDIG